MSVSSAPESQLTQPTPGGLRRVLRTRHAIITALAVIAPAGGILFAGIPIAANAGLAMPLSVVIGFVVILVIMNAIYRFTQHIASAGSFFEFVRQSLGVRAGFFAGWMFLAFYPGVIGFEAVLFGPSVNQIILAHGGPNIPWWVLTIADLLLIWGIAMLGIRLSVRSDFALLAFELGVLFVLALTILFTGAPGGDWHSRVFDPSASPTGLSGVTVGAVYGVLIFTGFEAPSYLGEETVEPKKTIPRAMLVTTIGIGIAYVFFFYVLTVGYGVKNIGKLPADAAPWDTIGRQYWSSGTTILVDIASVAALIGGTLAAQNGAARMVMALGREGLLPRSLGSVTKRFGTPGNALTLLLALSVAMTLGFGFGFQPLSAYSLLSLAVTLAALAVYMLAQFGVMRYFWRRGQYNVLWHGVIPTAAIAAIVYLYYKSVSPKPPYPIDLAIWITLGWAAVGLLVLAALVKFRPAELSAAASIVGTGGEPGPGEFEGDGLPGGESDRGGG